MLVLTRKYQEKIRIGNNITITVLRMKGKAVRLGIEAPADVPVIRGELAFEGEEESEEPEAEPTEAESTGRDVRRGRKFARIANVSGDWLTESNPNVALAADEKQGAKQVHFSRVPREKVAATLPEFIGGAAPLRAVMGRR